MYSTLLYASIRKSDCDANEIDNILSSARKNNPELDVTGVLLYNKKNFLQYLEGDYEKINKLYENIKKDERHKNVILVSRNKDTIDERLFPQWAMGGKDLESGEFAFHDLDDDTQKDFNKALEGNSLNENKSIEMIKKLFR